MFLQYRQKKDKFGEQYLLAKFYKYKSFLKVCFSA